MATSTMTQTQPATRTSASAGEIRLVIRGDDMGSCHAANDACIESYRNGIMRSAEVIVPGPWFLEAARMLNENPGLDAGVHLTLTAEWDLCKWRPLTHAPSVVDENGYFHPNVGQQGKPGSGFLGANPSREEIERELRAQVELGRKHIRNLTHLSSHMFGPDTDPLLREVTDRLSRDYGLPMHIEGVRWAGGLGEGPTTAQQKEDALVRNLEKLTAGLWIFVEHPGREVGEMQAMGIAPWYLNVAADREGVTRLFTSEKIRRIVRERGIRLVSIGEAVKGLG